MIPINWPIGLESCMCCPSFRLGAEAQWRQKFVESRIREAATAIKFYDLEQTMIRSQLMDGLIMNGREQVLPRDRGRQRNLHA
jgi:hypothetical protein